MFFRRSTSILSDEQLALKYREEEDPWYIGELFERYTHIVFLNCMKYLKNEDESEDATMAIFEKLIQDLKKYEIKRFKYWLHTVTKNHCLVLLERKQNLVKKENDLFYHLLQQHLKPPSTFHLPEIAELEENEKKYSELEIALTKLKAEQRQCIELFYLQQKRYLEVAEITGFSMKQVKSFIQNGKRNLKKHLKHLTINE